MVQLTAYFCFFLFSTGRVDGLLSAVVTDRDGVVLLRGIHGQPG